MEKLSEWGEEKVAIGNLKKMKNENQYKCYDMKAEVDSITKPQRPLRETLRGQNGYGYGLDERKGGGYYEE